MIEVLQARDASTGSVRNLGAVYPAGRVNEHSRWGLVMPARRTCASGGSIVVIGPCGITGSKEAEAADCVLAMVYGLGASRLPRCSVSTEVRQTALSRKSRSPRIAPGQRPEPSGSRVSGAPQSVRRRPPTPWGDVCPGFAALARERSCARRSDRRAQGDRSTLRSIPPKQFEAKHQTNPLLAVHAPLDGSLPAWAA
jgi:hypothetical protein